MTKHILHVILRAGLPAFVLMFQTGCSVFQSSRAIDMAPFAENTQLMFAEAAKVSRPVRWSELKEYYSLPVVAGFREKAQPVIRGLRALVMYSNQLVALNMSAKSDKEKNRLLAQYLREAMTKVASPAILDTLGVSPSLLDSVYSDIEHAPEFREGIAAASPLVSAVVLALNRGLDRIDEEVPLAIAAVDREVELKYADKRRNYRGLVRMQTETQYAVTLLYDARKGDRAALSEAMEADPSVREFITSPEKATPAMYKAAEDALTQRLERVDAYLNQLKFEKAAYLAKQEELESLRLGIDEKIKVARNAVAIWAQSHRNLGDGIAVPPLFDVVGMAGGLARKVVPLP
jgi:hypothetical protein